MDDEPEAEWRLTALADLIAAAEAEVLRLWQAEREAEAQLAHLRLTPPTVLWPEGVTLTVEGAGRTPDVSPAIELAKPRRRVEAVARREAALSPSAPVAPSAPISLAASESGVTPEPFAAAAAQGAEPDPQPAAPVAAAAPEPNRPTALVPASARRRPKNLMEALS